jgi:hypothetical protein
MPVKIGSGMDAEMKLQLFMQERGLTPLAMGISRNMCAICAFITQEPPGGRRSSTRVR